MGHASSPTLLTQPRLFADRAQLVPYDQITPTFLINVPLRPGPRAAMFRGSVYLYPPDKFTRHNYFGVDGFANDVGCPHVILTPLESNTRLGAYNIATLSRLVLDFWGSNFHAIISQFPLYPKWLSYFIESDACYGVVHAWIQTLIRNKAFAELSDPVVRSAVSMGTPQQSDNMLDRDPQSYLQPQRKPFDGIGFPAQPRGRKNGGIDLNEDCRPRFLWDICANKVVPSVWFVNWNFHDAISHSWVDNSELEPYITEINHGLWPVPLPRGVEPDSIRFDLIRHGIMYAWLDVLCLRQPSPPHPGLDPPTSADLRTARESCRNE